jgi:hypothetical protein
MTRPQAEGNGWGEYQRLVLSELERLDGSIQKLDDKLDDSIQKINDKIDDLRKTEIKSMGEEIQVLKFKAGLWGALAGMIPVLITLGLYVMFKK